jgi:integrase
MIIAQAGLGLRAGELCGLRVEGVDFRREVQIRDNSEMKAL